MSSKLDSDTEAVERGLCALREGAPISHRGHAWKLLCIALPQDTYPLRVYNKSITAYEADIGQHLLTREQCEAVRDKVRVKAYHMTAQEVRHHLECIPEADALFWECWRLYKDDGMWARALYTKDFAVHFVKQSDKD